MRMFQIITYPEAVSTGNQWLCWKSIYRQEDAGQMYLLRRISYQKKDCDVYFEETVSPSFITIPSTDFLLNNMKVISKKTILMFTKEPNHPKAFASS